MTLQDYLNHSLALWTKYLFSVLNKTFCIFTKFMSRKLKISTRGDVVTEEGNCD